MNYSQIKFRKKGFTCLLLIAKKLVQDKLIKDFITIEVHAERCPQNHPCPLVKLCPQDAITQERFKAPEIDHDKCVECGICTRSCAYHAVVEE